MYPSIVDMNENESSKCLRMLELDAYANMLAALRAQGPPTNDKLRLLKDIGTALRIPQERCKAEIRKVILDERLNTIAYYSCGQLETADEWIKEGRRLISLMPRVAPQTIYSAIADEVADAASLNNEQLPMPPLADRKRMTPVSQVQQTVPESNKPQSFRMPDAFKSEDSKKRKLPVSVEGSTLAQHLVGPSKISRIQQIYRQKVKAKAKEQQSKMKQQEQESQDFRHLHQQSRVFQQPPQFSSRVQKVPLTPQPSTSSSPKINILQNISIQPPNRGEETIEQIKNEVNSFVAQKAAEQNRTSPQPGCSNENQAPKQPKQAVVNVKPNANITYKHVASPGPSSEAQKSLKVCSTRKAVTKTVPGQKLIIVSNAQSITTSSILQRTLTIPFVKNISVKNFDKFKIVSTSTNTSNLQLTSLPNTSTSTLSANSAKHKVVTVRTNPATKKVIPLAHLQTLNTKGGIKMLSVGGKIITKATVTTPTTVPPLCLINSISSMQAATKTISSFTSSQLQEDARTKTQDAIVDESSNQEAPNESTKTDILKASGVIASDSESFVDIESHITQYAIPQSVPDRIIASEVNQEFEVVENSEAAKCHDEAQNNGQTYVLMGKNQDNERLLKDLEDDNSTDGAMGNLDPGTGEYTVETLDNCEDDVDEPAILSEDSYDMEVQKAPMMVNTSDINAVN